MLRYINNLPITCLCNISNYTRLDASEFTMHCMTIYTLLICDVRRLKIAITSRCSNVDKCMNVSIGAI